LRASYPPISVEADGCKTYHYDIYKNNYFQTCSDRHPAQTAWFLDLAPAISKEIFSEFIMSARHSSVVAQNTLHDQ